jgi:hypothetical protein
MSAINYILDNFICEACNKKIKAVDAYRSKCSCEKYLIQFHEFYFHYKDYTIGINYRFVNGYQIDVFYHIDDYYDTDLSSAFKKIKLNKGSKQEIITALESNILLIQKHIDNLIFI